MPEAARRSARHLVLIHGAWQGAWAFDAWAPLLHERGFVVHAVDLPGNGWGPQADAPASLAAYTEHVLALLATLPGPAVLVGHSGGGLTASQVAQAAPERVAGLVYLAGMMLPSGLAFAELLRRCEAEAPAADLAGIGPHLQWSADGCTSQVPEAAALEVFLHDCEPAAARRAASLLRPQPETGRATVNRLDPAHFGRVPRIYVECRQDRSLRLPVQRAMQALSPGATRLSLDTGHVPQLAQPMQLSELLCPLIERLPAWSPSLSSPVP
jgi:pimeloyl-ACP methyl ester carboxylesterase